MNEATRAGSDRSLEHFNQFHLRELRVISVENSFWFNKNLVNENRLEDCKSWKAILVRIKNHDFQRSTSVIMIPELHANVTFSYDSPSNRRFQSIFNFRKRRLIAKVLTLNTPYHPFHPSSSYLHVSNPSYSMKNLIISYAGDFYIKDGSIKPAVKILLIENLSIHCIKGGSEFCLDLRKILIISSKSKWLIFFYKFLSEL